MRLNSDFYRISKSISIIGVYCIYTLRVKSVICYYFIHKQKYNLNCKIRYILFSEFPYTAQNILLVWKQWKSSYVTLVIASLSTTIQRRTEERQSFSWYYKRMWWITSLSKTRQAWEICLVRSLIFCYFKVGPFGGKTFMNFFSSHSFLCPRCEKALIRVRIRRDFQDDV